MIPVWKPPGVNPPLPRWVLVTFDAFMFLLLFFFTLAVLCCVTPRTADDPGVRRGVVSHRGENPIPK